jgi:hypothetical protein
MILPLSEQLDEQYERKQKRIEAEESMKGDESNVFDTDFDPTSFSSFDKYMKVVDEAKLNQKSLKNTLTTEQIQKQEKLKRRMEELDKFERGESVDMRILKQKSRLNKYKAPLEDDIQDEFDDHMDMPKVKKTKYRFW